MDKKNIPQKEESDNSNYYSWVSVGIEFAVLIGIGAFLGYLLDTIQDTEPGFIIIGALAGFAFEMYIVLKRAGLVKGKDGKK